MVRSFITLITALLISSFASAAVHWKQVATETIWPNSPFMREVRINSTEKFSEVRVYVTMGTLRLNNIYVWTTRGQEPLWALRGDYRSPRAAEARFLEGAVRSIRFEAQSLEPRSPAQLQIFIR